MTVSHASAAAAAAFLLAATAAALSSNAAPTAAVDDRFAQVTSGPVQLGPRRAVPTEPLPPQPDVAPTAPAPVSPSSPDGRSGPVEIEMLTAVDADSVGIIDDQDGGLGADMWEGADRAFVARTLALLPRRVGSPVMRDLMRRLLLTRAMAPPRSGKAASLLSLRVGALFVIGDLESAMALIASAPIGPINEPRLRFEVESRFLRQDTAGACGHVRGAAQDYKDEYWQQAMAYCLALAGKTAEAALLSDILAERAKTVHPAFFAAMDRLAGASPPTVESLAEPSALYLSMMRTASLALPADVLFRAAPAVQRAVALSPNAELELRLTAAENAAASGVLPGAVLNEVYGAVPFDAAALEEPLSKAEADWGSRGRALLMRAAASQEVPAARAEVLQRALRLAQAKGGYKVIAVASEPYVKPLEPSPDLAWFAASAARALIATGDLEAARKWIALDLDAARDKAGGAPGDLWPLAVLIGAEGGEATPEALLGWWRAREQSGATDLKNDAQVLFGLLDALDIGVPTELWSPLLEVPRPKDAAVPAAGVQIALRRAAAAQRRGETTALALVALGEAGPSAGNLLAVDMAIRGLRQVGLAAEAQRLALEAAVAAGL